MRNKDGKKVYKVSLPATALRRLAKVTNPNSDRIAFGIHTVQEVQTNSGPGMLVKGTEEASHWADPKYTEFLVDVGKIKSDKGVGVWCFHWREMYWVRAVRPDRQAAQTYGKRGQGRIIQYILLPVELNNRELNMTLLDHLNLGGCIRHNPTTKKITLVRDSLLSKIPCSEQDLNDLKQHGLVVGRQDGDETVYRRADVETKITQADREIFRTLVRHWNDTDGELPGNCNYQMLFDLCDKFSVPRPKRVEKSLSWTDPEDINDTDMFPMLVSEITQLLKEQMGGWYHIRPDNTSGEIEIIVCKEKFYTDDIGSREVGRVIINSKTAQLTCSGVGRPLVLELTDPACFDKMHEWCQKLQRKNPWKS
jgi:hypothetical protein